MNPVLASFFRRCANSPHRRTLTVLLFVLLGHVLLIWVLIQNRWIVVSETTVTFMPPIMASIVLSQTNSKNGKSDNAKAAPRNRLDGDLDLKPSREISFGALRVQRSVPWLNTELLPELRGNSSDAKADRQERTGRGGKEPQHPSERPKATAAASAHRTERKHAAKSKSRHDEPVLSIPPPESDVVQLIPPPPQQQPALVTVPMPAPAPPEPRPTANIPAIPDPVRSGPRDIPSLWSNTPTPPPALVLIPPTPPQLKTIAPAAAPVSAPVALPEPPTAVVKPAPEPVRAAPPPPRVAATVPPPPPPPPKAVPPVAPPELPPAPPLALTPSVTLPSPAQPSPPVAANVIVVPPPAPAPVAPAAPASPIAPVASPSAGATAVTEAPAATVRNPMVVEVPRYRIAEPNPSASPVNAVAGPGSSGNAANKTDQTGASGGRTGPDGAGGKSGSMFGLGVAAPDPAPPALPTATAPNSAKAKALNLSLPRVEVYKGPPMGRPLSVSEMANAQLRRGESKDPVAEAVNSAENPDCVKPDKDGSGGGLLAAPVMAYRAMTGKCK